MTVNEALPIGSCECPFPELFHCDVESKAIRQDPKKNKPLKMLFSDSLQKIRAQSQYTRPNVVHKRGASNFSRKWPSKSVTRYAQQRPTLPALARTECNIEKSTSAFRAAHGFCRVAVSRIEVRTHAVLGNGGSSRSDVEMFASVLLARVGCLSQSMFSIRVHFCHKRYIKHTSSLHIHEIADKVFVRRTQYTHGVLRFDHLPLSEVLEQMQLWHQFPTARIGRTSRFTSQPLPQSPRPTRKCLRPQ